MTIAAHLIECATLDEAREKAEQLVFIYKSNNPTSTSSDLIHAQQNDTREGEEHQLAVVNKGDKQHTSDSGKGSGNKANRQNNQQQNNNQGHRGQGGYRKQRGRYNQRTNYQRGRGFNSNDQRYFSRGRGFGRGRGFDQNNDQYQYEYQKGRGHSSFCRPWRGCGNYNPRGRGFTPSDTGDPQYKGIPQYKYLCGICHNRGHYDHQCHTLQHLFHAMQLQNRQSNAPVTTNYDNQTQNEQQTF